MLCLFARYRLCPRGVRERFQIDYFCTLREARESVCKYPVTVLGGVLVTQCSSR